MGEPLEPLRRLTRGERTALAARDRLEHPLPGTKVPEQLQCPAERGVVRLPAARVGAGDIQVGEDCHEEIVLVDEVRVERRAPHVRAIDHVLDGHPLVALFEDEVGQGLLQRLPRLAHAPIRSGCASSRPIATMPPAFLNVGRPSVRQRTSGARRRLTSSSVSNTVFDIGHAIRKRKRERMGTIVVSDNLSLDGVMQDPAGDEDSVAADGSGSSRTARSSRGSPSMRRSAARRC